MKAIEKLLGLPPLCAGASWWDRFLYCLTGETKADRYMRTKFPRSWEL